MTVSNTGESDAFARLGIEPAFRIDTALVQQRWLQLVARHHPDRFTDPIARARAAEELASINAARDSLLDDERRASLMLDRLGGPSASLVKDLPPGFLLEVLDLRDELEQARAGDAPSRAHFIRSVEERLAQERAAIAMAMIAAEENPTPDRLRAARIALNAARYVERLRAQLAGTAAP